MSPVDCLNSLDDVVNGQLVLVLKVCAALVSIDLPCHDSSLVLDEVESLDHELGCGSPMHTDREHTNHTTS